MVEFLDGVRSQPDVLATSREAVRAALSDLDTTPLQHGTTLLLGIGASGHAATLCASRLRERGAAAYALSAGDGPPSRADRYIGISYSGRSTETVEALDALGAGARIGVTGHVDVPLAGVVDRLVSLGGVADTKVSTLSYTATVQALGMLVDDAWGRFGAFWDELPEYAAAVLADRTHADRIATTFADVSSIDVIGSGPRAGSAGAAGLLLREAAHLPAAAYSLREYLHGPLETAAPGRGALIFGSGRAARLAEEMTAWGSPTVLITADPSVRRTPDGPTIIHLPDVPPPALDVLDLLPVQLAAAELATRAGVPIALRHMPADTKLPDPGDGVAP